MDPREAAIQAAISDVVSGVLLVNELLQRRTRSLEARLRPDYVVHRHVNLATNTSSD